MNWSLVPSFDVISRHIDQLGCRASASRELEALGHHPQAEVAAEDSLPAVEEEVRDLQSALGQRVLALLDSIASGLDRRRRSQRHSRLLLHFRQWCRRLR